MPEPSCSKVAAWCEMVREAVGSFEAARQQLYCLVVIHTARVADGPNAELENMFCEIRSSS